MEAELSGLVAVPLCDTGMTGSSVIYCPTVLAPVSWYYHPIKYLELYGVNAVCFISQINDLVIVKENKERRGNAFNKCDWD